MNSFMLRLLQACAAGSPLGRRLAWRGRRSSGGVALTFDDGPRAPFTPLVLERLARHGARGTFFVEGRWVRENPDLLATVVAAGHAVGNHAFEHVTGGPLRSQVRLCDSLLRANGVATRLFRPPFGAVGVADLAWLAIRGYRTVLWSVDAHDSMRHEGKWTRPGPDYRRLRAGDIILLHDDNPVCLDDLERILDALPALGLEPLTVPEVLGWPVSNSGASIHADSLASHGVPDRNPNPNRNHVTQNGLRSR